jgi:hypothetical protein
MRMSPEPEIASLIAPLCDGISSGCREPADRVELVDGLAVTVSLNLGFQLPVAQAPRSAGLCRTPLSTTARFLARSFSRALDRGADSVLPDTVHASGG